MSELYFLKLVFYEKIWGGIKLYDDFNYDIFSDYIGECWVILVYLYGLVIVENGLYVGMILDWVWVEYCDVFGDVKGDVFLLLMKILDVSEDLLV